MPETKKMVDKNNGKKPKLRRYSNIREELRSNLQNVAQTEWINTKKVESREEKFNCIDLFCGAGGLSLGFEQAGFTTRFGADWYEPAIETFKKNFSKAGIWEDSIKKLEPETIEEHLNGEELHVLCAGFPCPGFSIAGDRENHDTRNYLYDQVRRIANELEPWFIVMENVGGFVTIGDGYHYNRITRNFDEIGYQLSAHILEAAEYETPQIRPRTILIGNKFDDIKNPYPRPIIKEEENFVPIEEAINDLKEHPRDPDINHVWTNHREDTIERISEVEPGESLYDSYQDAFKRQYKGVPAMTVKENHGGTHIHPDLNRCISVREMARLQGFPDDFFFEGTHKEGMKQVGNAVPIPLARHVALAVRFKLEKIKKRV